MSCTKSNRWKNILVPLLHLLLPLLLPLLLLHSTDAAKKGFDVLQCESALGMQNGLIEDADITASSSSDNRRRGPAAARIRTEKGDGAWCPKSPISSDSYEYLEIDLRQLKVITLVETQGRFENGQGTEHADQYRLEYQREDGGTWFRYKNRRGQETIQGNSNTYIAEMRDIKPLIVGRRIRFVPVSSHVRNVCLRVELYGCSFSDGMVSYEMPQGHRYGPGLDLTDRFYDGSVGADGVLRNGLGLLTNGAEGQANFQLDDSSDAGVRSFQWIGWKNDSLSTGPLSIVFKFDAPRNFSMLYVRSNNMFSKGVRVFRLARLYFGLDEKNFGRLPDVQYSYARDNQAEYARTVKIPLEYNVGIYVKLELVFDVKWIMISEIHFESEYVTADVIGKDDVEEEGRRDSVHHVTFSPSHVTRISGFLEIKNDNVTQRRSPDHWRLVTPPPSPQGNDVIYVKDWTKKSSSPENSPSVSTSTDAAGLWNQPGIRNGLDYGSVVVMIIVLAVLSLVLCSVLVLIFHRRHRLTCIPGPCSAAVSKSSAILTNPPSTCSISRPSSLLYPSSYLIHSTFSSSSAYRPPALPVPSSFSSAYHADDPSQSTASDFLISPTTVASPYATVDLPPPPPPPPLPQGAERLTEIAGDESSSSSSLDGIYSTPASLQLLQQAAPLSCGNIPRSSLKYVKSLGEGHFGQVYVCEVLDICASEGGKFGSRLIVDKFSSLMGATVSVKVLQHNASEFKRSLFEREMKKCSRLVDPNIAAMLMCYTDQEPFCIVLEYSPLGDLKSFLRQRGAEQARRDGLAPGSCDLLSYGCLVFIACQIASGMKHFEELGLVHRDLSARNCIVSENLAVKISDLGVGHHLYAEDYSTCAGQVVLPIRWMAWESVLMGSFTVKSDVWSFGVTVWEILTLAVELPYAGLTDDAVIDNCHNISSSSSSCEGVSSSSSAAVRLGQPPRCPRELYDLLCHCWARDEALRPTFREVHMFLRMKSAGFNPDAETLLCRP